MTRQVKSKQRVADHGEEMKKKIVVIDDPVSSMYSDGLHYVEECSDDNQYKEVLRLIFEAMGQGQHYRIMRKEEMRNN